MLNIGKHLYVTVYRFHYFVCKFTFVSALNPTTCIVIAFELHSQSESSQ